MLDMNALDQEYPSLRENLEFIEQRGILPGPEGHGTRQLAGELSRRGWRWTFDPERAEATKAYTPSGTVKQTVSREGTDTIANLITVLADAIRFDETRDLSPTHPFQADIVVRAPDGQAIALTEVKNRKGLTRDLATTWRRNLLTHGFRSPNTPFFMLVSQDDGYLWDQRQTLRLDAPPTVTFSMRPAIERYLPWLKLGERLGEPQLQLVVAKWLNDLAEGQDSSLPPLDESLDGTGFLDMIKGASVRSEFLP